MKSAAKDKLIVALDVDTAQRARQLVALLGDLAAMFKIGSQLFTAAGPEIVREIVRSGSRVFLDLKFHDIPNTVAAAATEAARLGVSILNVHALGGGEMMRHTADAVAEVVAKEGLPRPSVIAVTVLTSADATTLRELGIDSLPDEQVVRLALLAHASGLDGVVASPHEIKSIRRSVRTPGFLVITPGVRPAGATADDQKRVTTPAQAIEAGADYVVIGRPITASEDPVRSASKMVEEMQAVLT